MKAIVSLLFFTALVLVAALYGLTVTGDGRPTAINGSGYTTWIAGVISGILIAWIARVRWAELPYHLGLWFQLQRRRFGWMACGLLCVGVLLLY